MSSAVLGLEVTTTTPSPSTTAAAAAAEAVRSVNTPATPAAVGGLAFTGKRIQTELFMAGLAIALGGLIVLLSGDTLRRRPAPVTAATTVRDDRQDGSTAPLLAALAAGGLASWLRRRR